VKLPISWAGDAAGRMVIQLAVEPRDFGRLMAHAADAVKLEDGGDDEPYEGLPGVVSSRARRGASWDPSATLTHARSHRVRGRTIGAFAA